MKSLLLLVNDIHFKGGGERVASNFASHYAKQGYDVTILSMGVKKISSLFPTHENVKIEYLSIHHSKFISKFHVFFKLRKYLRECYFNHLLGIGTYASIILSFLPSKYSRSSIGCEHSSWDNAHLIWRILRKFSYPHLDALVVLTKADLPSAKKVNKNAFTIPNAINLMEQTAALINKSILAIGQLYPTKGFDLMIEMFKDFSKQNINWNLKIVGDGRLKSELLSLIHKYGLDNRVKIIPPTNNIDEYYLESSILLMTSRHEGFPMVLLEAQSFGIPVLAYDCKTGPREIIDHNKSGMVIPFGDKDKMVESLIRLCTDKKLRLLMGQNAKQNVKRFSPENVYKLWDELFTKL